MPFYIASDFHAHQQTVAWCDTETGETQITTLKHNLEQVRAFYASLPPGIVGVEASSKARWFEDLLEETGHQLVVGNPLLIRRRATSRHKSDKRDAELILQLLLRDEFPAIWRRSREQTQVLEILKLRHSLVRQRTQIYNRLQALAKSCGLGKARTRTTAFQEQLKATPLDEVEALQRSQLLQLIGSFDQQLKELDKWLAKRAALDAQVQLLLTQPGVGTLTALALVNSLGDISRFTHPTKQVPAYFGLDPLEKESAGKRQAAGTSRAGSAITRFLLGQAAQSATRRDPQLKAFYKRLAKKKPIGVAKTAVARKLLVKLVIMLRDAITAEKFDQRGGISGGGSKSSGIEKSVI